MKRTVIGVLAIALAVALVPTALEAGVGVKAGLSLAKLRETSSVPLTFSWGNLPYYVGGLSFEGRIALIALQPEVLYVRMGGRYRTMELEVRLDYIQVPVLLKLYTIPAGPIRPFFYLGGYGAYLLRAKSILGPAEADLIEDHERFDYGLVGGAGLAFKLMGITLSVEGRYNNGLMNILKEPAAGESRKNRCLMALAGLSF